MVTKDGILLTDTLVTFSHAPGYGDMTITFMIDADGEFGGQPGELQEVKVVLSREDVARLGRYVDTVKKFDRGL